MFDQIKQSNRILFILETHFSYDASLLKALKNAAETRYPEKRIDWRIMQFSADADEEYVDGSMHVCRYARAFNSYDLYETNFEWSFLDGLRLTQAAVPQNAVCPRRKEIKIFSTKFKKKRFIIKFFIENA